MSERYKRVFSLHEDLYAEGSPIILAAGALLKDTQTDRMLAQLKLRSISEQRITAVTVCIQPLDPARRPLGAPVYHPYLDLAVRAGDEFGQKVPVVLPKTTRSFTVEVTEVVFGDCSVWSGTQEPWTSVIKPQPLTVKLQGLEMVKQYRLKYGQNSEVYPVSDRDLWYCACGRLNRNLHRPCRCGKHWDTLQACSLSELRGEMELRLEQERQAEEAARLAAEQALAEAKAAKEAKQAKIKEVLKKYRVWIVLLAVVVLLGGAAPLGMHIGKSVRYHKAEDLLEKGRYEEAIEAFASLEDFKDSSDRKAEAEFALVTETTYAQANALFEEGKYREAMAVFRTVHDYAESSAMEERCAVELTKAQFEAAADHETAAKHLENLKLYDLEEAKTYYAEGWYTLYTKAMEAENVANAEACLAKLSDRADIEELTQETAKLQTYLEAKAISVTNKTTRDQLEELLNKLPEDYKEVAVLREIIKAFDEKQKATAANPVKPAASVQPAKQDPPQETAKVQEDSKGDKKSQQKTDYFHGLTVEQMTALIIGSWGYTDFEGSKRPSKARMQINADGTYSFYLERYPDREDVTLPLGDPTITQETGVWSLRIGKTYQGSVDHFIISMNGSESSLNFNMSSGRLMCGGAMCYMERIG